MLWHSFYKNCKGINFGLIKVKFPFLDGDVRRRPSYVVSTHSFCQGIIPSRVIGLKSHNRFLSTKLLKQGYGYHKLRKVFSKLRFINNELTEIYKVSLNRISANPDFYRI